MVIDSSAIVAILLDESDGVMLAKRLTAAADPVISAASLLESSIVMHKRDRADGVLRLDRLFRRSGIRCVSVDHAQAIAARRAWVRYGRGNSPAGLNFGDCFSYALARTMDRPLLFKGGDFTRTDVRVVT